MVQAFKVSFCWIQDAKSSIESFSMFRCLEFSRKISESSAMSWIRRDPPTRWEADDVARKIISKWFGNLWWRVYDCSCAWDSPLECCITDAIPRWTPMQVAWNTHFRTITTCDLWLKGSIQLGTYHLESCMSGFWAGSALRAEKDFFYNGAFSRTSNACDSLELMYLQAEFIGLSDLCRTWWHV